MFISNKIYNLLEIGKRNRVKTKNRKKNDFDSSKVIQNKFRINKFESFESCQIDDGNSSELDYLPCQPNEISDLEDLELEFACSERPIDYTAEQLQEINQCYEQNCIHLREIFNLPEMQKAIKGIIHLADHIRKEDEDNNVNHQRDQCFT